MNVRFKTVKRFSDESGYSPQAIRDKIHSGAWMEGRVWRRAPDGHILIDTEGYAEWVMNGNGLAVPPSLKRRKSHCVVDRASGSTTVEVTGTSPTPLV